LLAVLFADSLIEEGPVKRLSMYSLTVAWIGCALAVVGIGAQEAAPADENAHFVTARTATDGCQDAKDLFDSLCFPREPRAPAPGGGSAPRAPRPEPEYADYHRDPVKVFDNLYYLGTTREISWAIETSEGLIILDTMSAYAFETEIWDGLKELGFDPVNDVKIIVLSHGHIDHYEGAKFLQERIPGVRTYMTAIDWDLMEQGTSGAFGGVKPTRDMESHDKMKLTLGDTTLEFHLIPGHTPGNTSVLIPVRDGDQEHLAMFWGGTALPQEVEVLRTYAESVANFRTIAVEAGADVILGGHPHRDGSNRKLPLLAERKPGDPNPYVIGTDGVNKVLTAISECAAYTGDLVEAREAAE
jgi:metallo-beta-lactamase class B